MTAPLALLLSLLPAMAPPPDRPNIVIIVSDDMGFSDLGCYGGEIRTPNLDRLAGNGLRFTQFYNTARCCPTRASLLTGLYPHQAGIGHMMEDRGLDGYRGDLNRRSATIAEALRPAGYGTYAVGKWHVTRHVQPNGPKHNWPLQRGFDRYYGTIAGGGSYYDPGTLTRDNTPISPLADPEYKPERFYYTDAISHHAARFITEHSKEQADKPFFLYTAFTAAHWPMHALEEDIAKYKGMYDNGYDPIRKARLEKAKGLGIIDPSWTPERTLGDWSAVKDKEWEARGMEVYAAMIDRMDRGIGEIVAALEAAGKLDNTLIFFLQDNGACAEGVGRDRSVPRVEFPTFPTIAADALRQEVRPKQTREGFPMRMGPGEMPGPADTYIAYGWGWANASNTPFRYYKHWVHEGGISTPLIAHWPAKIADRGGLYHEPGHLIDLMATCLDVSGAAFPERIGDQQITPPEGVSLAPAFAKESLPDRTIFWEHEGNRAVRRGPWKLVARGREGPWELYNIPKDRTEHDNLAGSEPDRVREMTAEWDAWAKRANVLPWPWKQGDGISGAIPPGEKRTRQP